MNRTVLATFEVQHLGFKLQQESGTVFVKFSNATEFVRALLA